MQKHALRIELTGDLSVTQTETPQATQEPLPLSYAPAGGGGRLPRANFKILGILALLIVVCLYTAWQSEAFLTEANIMNLVRRTGLYGVLGVGVAFVIITGGIDLSIGSVVALVGCLMPWLLIEHKWSVSATISFLLALSAAIGVAHGLLITKLRLQPFVVTLCGLLIYRGLARGILEDQTQGFGNEFAAMREALTGDFLRIPMAFWILIAVSIVAAIFLNRTIWGRYLFALGRNEQAARYSGINTDRMILLAYVICALLAGFGGILFMTDVNSGQPVDFGNVYELYAISAAVLGGCSLRGGEGSILGVLIGTAVMRVLYNAINLLDIKTQWEFAIIGGVLLGGVIADELVKRVAAKRRAAKQAA
jgi:ribose transport system permease protein